MLNALHKIQKGEVTATVCSDGVWQADNMLGASGGLLESRDALHTQIGIAIGYGYVAGKVTFDNNRVLYRQLTLTSRGREFLATVESSPSITNLHRPQLRTKIIASTLFVIGLLMVSLLAIVLVPHV